MTEPNENQHKEEIEVLTDLGKSLEDPLSKIGLYTEEMMILPEIAGDSDSNFLVALHCSIGDIAFMQRTQDPEGDKFDRQFREMTSSMQNDELLDEYTRLKRNLDAGRDPYDDGDEIV